MGVADAQGIKTPEFKCYEDDAQWDSEVEVWKERSALWLQKWAPALLYVPTPLVASLKAKMGAPTQPKVPDEVQDGGAWKRKADLEDVKKKSAYLAFALYRTRRERSALEIHTPDWQDGEGWEARMETWQIALQDWIGKAIPCMSHTKNGPAFTGKKMMEDRVESNTAKEQPSLDEGASIDQAMHRDASLDHLTSHGVMSSSKGRASLEGLSKHGTSEQLATVTSRAVKDEDSRYQRPKAVMFNRSTQTPASAKSFRQKAKRKAAKKSAAETPGQGPFVWQMLKGNAPVSSSLPQSSEAAPEALKDDTEAKPTFKTEKPQIIHGYIIEAVKEEKGYQAFAERREAGDRTTLGIRTPKKELKNEAWAIEFNRWMGGLQAWTIRFRPRTAWQVNGMPMFVGRNLYQVHQPQPRGPFPPEPAEEPKNKKMGYRWRGVQGKKQWELHKALVAARARGDPHALAIKTPYSGDPALPVLQQWKDQFSGWIAAMHAWGSVHHPELMQDKDKLPLDLSCWA